ncbi:hypothetical protein J2T17_001518 [Paenibacillus mucilaginosus]
MRPTAVQLGAAMQLTNILRGVREDYERGRVYLPRTLMQRFGYSVSDMSQGVHAPGWRPLFRHLADLAETKYREGLSAMAYYPRDGRLSRRVDLSADSCGMPGPAQGCVQREGGCLQYEKGKYHALPARPGKHLAQTQGSSGR